MLYTIELEVNPLTAINEPVSNTLKVTKGMINKITVLFPPGCCTLVGIWIEYHTIQILPWSRNKQLFGAGDLMEFNVSIPINDEPYELIFYGYSEDDTYLHTIYFTVNLVNEETIPIASFGGIKP